MHRPTRCWPFSWRSWPMRRRRSSSDCSVPASTLWQHACERSARVAKRTWQHAGGLLRLLAGWGCRTFPYRISILESAPLPSGCRARRTQVGVAPHTSCLLPRPRIPSYALLLATASRPCASRVYSDGAFKMCLRSPGNRWVPGDMVSKASGGT